MEQNFSKESVQFDFSMQSEFSCMNKEKKWRKSKKESSKMLATKWSNTLK